MVAADENWDLCHECGGLCCCLYLAHDENGEFIGDDWLPDYVTLWLERFVESGALARTAGGYAIGPAGIAPLHDPLLSTSQSPEGQRYREGLPDWVDVRKCQFCHPDTGCLLPRTSRAAICREWVCELWEPEG
jgi:hypothetical protein